MATTLDAIDHIVVLMLENRSFDHVLGNLALPGIDVAAPGSTAGAGRPYQLLPRATGADLHLSDDPGHEYVDFIQQWGGSGLAALGSAEHYARKFPQASADEIAHVASICTLSDLPVIQALAQTYTVCDRWFSSVCGPTWPNRQFAVSGTTRGIITMPSSFGQYLDTRYYTSDQLTIFNLLENAKLPWRVYFEDIPQVLTLKRLRDIAYLGNFTDNGLTTFEYDAHNGTLPAFSWIEPDYLGTNANDCHPPRSLAMAEYVIAKVYNAVRTSPLWTKTLLVLVWDEWGGFSDHVTPRDVVAPDASTPEAIDFTDVGGTARRVSADFTRTGPRVPAILISPWSLRGLAPRQDASGGDLFYEHTSLLRTVCDRFGLPDALGARCTAAPSLASLLTDDDALRAGDTLGPVLQPTQPPPWPPVDLTTPAWQLAKMGRAAPTSPTAMDTAALQFSEHLVNETSALPSAPPAWTVKGRQLDVQSVQNHAVLAAGASEVVSLVHDRIVRFLQANR